MLTGPEAQTGSDRRDIWIICRDWKFDRATGAEIDDLLDLGATAKENRLVNYKDSMISLTSFRNSSLPSTIPSKNIECAPGGLFPQK